MKPINKVFLELLVIISSVFIFRGLWLLLDTVVIFNSKEFFAISLLIGITFSGIAFKKLRNTC
ncbi:MAG: hypothetical protein KKB79_02485 [Nanoarchaeota archaeon]|nr:hypothetical protein [Nanoarchaeota archaeon]